MSGQNSNPVAFGDPATEPVDLAQAFKAYEQANRGAAENPVEEGAADDEGAGAGGYDGGDGLGGSGMAGEEDALPAEQGGYGSVGGSADVIEPLDYDTRRREILSGLQQQAIAMVRADFNKNGIAPCTIEDLYQRDEQTGRAVFKNPDDPTEDFAGRAEAQKWCDAFNRQIEARFRQEINRTQQQLVASNAPMLRLIAFAPKYEMLNQAERDVLDDLVENYEVRDRGGNVVGYTIDLDAAAAQARRIAKRMPQQEAHGDGEKQGKPRQSGPAMDMPTGAGKSADAKEPTTLGEAMKMYNDMQRKDGKK